MGFGRFRICTILVLSVLLLGACSSKNEGTEQTNAKDKEIEQTAVSVNSTGQITSNTYESRTYKLFIPSNYKKGTAVPLVVMLHG